MTKLLALDILFLTKVRVVVVAKLVLLGIFLTSFILVLKAVVVVKLVILGISFLTSFILALSEVVIVAKLVISGIIIFSIFYLSIYTSFQQHHFYCITKFT